MGDTPTLIPAEIKNATATEVVSSAQNKKKSKAHAIEMWTGKILAAFITGAYATNLIPTSGTAEQVASIAATVLLYLGFTVARTRMNAPS